MKYQQTELGILDTETNLIWQNKPHGKCTFEAAMKLEKDGWRVPTIAELGTIVDKTKSPTIDPIFTDTKSNGYWSASSYAGYSDYAWVVYFNSGNDGSSVKNDSYYVRLVRSSQSDLKPKEKSKLAIINMILKWIRKSNTYAKTEVLK